MICTQFKSFHWKKSTTVQLFWIECLRSTRRYCSGMICESFQVLHFQTSLCLENWSDQSWHLQTPQSRTKGLCICMLARFRDLLLFILFYVFALLRCVCKESQELLVMHGQKFCYIYFVSLQNLNNSQCMCFHIKSKGHCYPSWLSGLYAAILCCVFGTWFCIIWILHVLIMILCVFMSHLAHWSLKLGYLLACCQVVVLSMERTLLLM